MEVGARTRIVSLGGEITEIVFALGCGDSIVGVDDSSTYPATKLQGVARVGSGAGIAAERILELQPTRLLVSATLAAIPALTTLRHSSITMEVLPGAPSLEGGWQRLKGVGRLLGKEERALTIVDARDGHVAAARKLATKPSRTPVPRVAFVEVGALGVLLAAGLRTAAGEAIRIAGGYNAFDDFIGMRRLVAEQVIAAAPALLLYSTPESEGRGGATGVEAVFGRNVPAPRLRRVLRVDPLALCEFGPRSGRALLNLAMVLHAVSDQRM